VPRYRLHLAAALALVAVAIGCGGDDDDVEGPPPEAPDRIRLESSAFRAGAAIPGRYSCDGEDVPPPLEWSGVPDGARSLALLVEDPDAPGGTFVHWTVWNMPATWRGLDGEPPPGSSQGENSSGETGWTGPCPPEDDSPHRYEFTIYALSRSLDLDEGASLEDVRSAIGDASLARGRLTGRFGR
jgi:Raf kinase inhibitor-like YbhB/YbcL family protein